MSKKKGRARNVLSDHAENMRHSVLQICGISFNRFALFCCGDLRRFVGVICGKMSKYFVKIKSGGEHEKQRKT